MNTNILHWIFNADTGISSMTMAATFLGIPYDKDHYGRTPGDPSDFNRCLKLLEAAPEARAYMPRLKSISPFWSALVDRWDEVEQCFLDEVGLDWSKGRSLRATKTFALMREIADSVATDTEPS